MSTLDRGRWAGRRTGCIYITDGLAVHMLLSLPSQIVVVPLREWAVALRCQKEAGLTAVRHVLRECVWCFSFTVPLHRCLNLTVLEQWVRQKGTRARTLKQRRSHFQFHMQVPNLTEWRPSKTRLPWAGEPYFLLVQETHFPRGRCHHRGVLDAVLHRSPQHGECEKIKQTARSKGGAGVVVAAVLRHRRCWRQGH